MHSKNRGNKWVKVFMMGGGVVATFALAGAAIAGDPNERRHRAADRSDRFAHRNEAARAERQAARLYDARLDRRGALIDEQLNLLAFVAAATGEYALAHELDRVGDRIERRYDRIGDRALRDTRRHIRHERKRGHYRHGRKHHQHRGHAKARRHNHDRRWGHSARVQDRRHDHRDRGNPRTDRRRNEHRVERHDSRRHEQRARRNTDRHFVRNRLHK